MAEDPGQSQGVRLAFRIGYIGTGFSGSQVQPDRRTVEGEIAAACTRAGIFTDRKTARMALSGRTDQGVHARCQVMAFTTEKPDLAIKALNGQLPVDIWVTSWSYAPPDFYPRFDVTSRTYRFYYRCLPPDIPAMVKAAELFYGTHDFTCFARIEPGKNCVRTIDRIEIGLDGSVCWFEITATSFLWHQVRSIATALLDVSQGMMTTKDLMQYLSGRCTNKVRPADPEGLILWEVRADLPWQDMVIPHIKQKKLNELTEQMILMGRVQTLIVPGHKEK